MRNNGIIHRWMWAVGLVLIAAVMLLFSNSGPATEVTIYKSATCGCCAGWIRHLESNGFTVRAHNVPDVSYYKERFGVRPELATCHTAVVEGYVVEGHVPARDIKRLLSERPSVTGIAVPGMPLGSPGMEGPRKDRYQVYSFDNDGHVEPYASH